MVSVEQRDYPEDCVQRLRQLFSRYLGLLEHAAPLDLLAAL